MKLCALEVMDIVLSLVNANYQLSKCILTGCPCTTQTKVEKAKSLILVKLGWVDQPIGGVDHTKYFHPGVTLMGVRAHPNFELTNKN